MSNYTYIVHVLYTLSIACLIIHILYIYYTYYQYSHTKKPRHRDSICLHIAQVRNSWNQLVIELKEWKIFMKYDNDCLYNALLVKKL